jgi:F0F1-type ATP synthase membrane subunit b/b'
VDQLLKEFVKIWWHIPAIMGLVFIYAFLLNRALFRPVQKVLRERKEQIRESDQLSQHSREELKRRFEEYERAVLEAHRKGTHLKEEARNQANAYRASILSQVKAEMDAEMAKADGILRGDLEGIQKEIQVQMPEFARSLVGKILGREVAL